MSRDRFKEISRSLKFYFTNALDAEDKFTKMRFIFTHIKQKMLSAFEPYEHLCVDEQVYSYRGKSRFRKYMPNKPSKYGIKYWCICDVTTSYLCYFDVYLGKERGNKRNVNLGEKVTLQFPSHSLEHIEQSHATIFSLQYNYLTSCGIMDSPS